MQIGMPLSYAGGFHETVEEIVDHESVGVAHVSMPEVYTFDAVSLLGYLAARTSTITLASGILNIYTRTPSVLGMTAAGMDYVSGGRFMLGIGASGPQVVEGFHGVAYDAPVARMREVVTIARQVWRREKVSFDGKYYHVPLTKEYGGSGLGKPLRLINTPPRADIPVALAALGPKSIELAAELFDAWEPIFYAPESAADVFGAALAKGAAKRPAEMAPLQVIAQTRACVTTNDEEYAAALAGVRDFLALYVGGMGARGKNFYNDLACRMGFADVASQIQDRYLDGRPRDAAAAVPEEMVHAVSIIGTPEHCRARVAAYAGSGVGVLSTVPMAETAARRVEIMRDLVDMAAKPAR